MSTIGTRYLFCGVWESFRPYIRGVNHGFSGPVQAASVRFGQYHSVGSWKPIWTNGWVWTCFGSFRSRGIFQIPLIILNGPNLMADNFEDAWALEYESTKLFRDSHKKSPTLYVRFKMFGAVSVVCTDFPLDAHTVFHRENYSILNISLKSITQSMVVCFDRHIRSIGDFGVQPKSMSNLVQHISAEYEDLLAHSVECNTRSDSSWLKVQWHLK